MHLAQARLPPPGRLWPEFPYLGELAHLGNDEAHILFLRNHREALEWFVPGVKSQVEGSIVGREEPLASQFLVGLDDLFGKHVDAFPLQVVCTCFKQREVEWSEALSDFLQAGEIVSVTAEEDSIPLGPDDPRRP